MTTTPDAISAIAAVLAEIEKNQRQAIKKARKLRDEYQAVHDNGDAGALLAMASFAALDAMVTGQYSETLAFHLDQTRQAVHLGIDVGPLPPGDHDDGDFSVQGGGDR